MFTTLTKILLTSFLLVIFNINPTYGVDDPLKIGAIESEEEDIEKFEESEEGEKEIIIRKGDIVKFGESIEIEANELVEGDVVAIGGAIVVRGSVEGDVVSIGGNVQLDSTSVVEGDVCSIGGSVNGVEGCIIGGDEISIGPGFVLPHHFGGPGFAKPFFMKKTFSVIGKVVRIAILIIIALLLVVFLPKPMARVENTVRHKFFATLGFGILGEILICPLLVALAVSVIGIPFIPLAILALIAGLIFGYTGVSLLVGNTFVERLKMKSTSPLTAIIFGVILIELVSLLGRLVGLGGGMGMWGGIFQGIGTLVIILGFIVTYVAWTLGLGSMIITRFGTREPLVPAVVQSTEESQSSQT
jgi:hypothetical protein